MRSSEGNHNLVSARQHRRDLILMGNQALVAPVLTSTPSTGLPSLARLPAMHRLLEEPLLLKAAGGMPRIFLQRWLSLALQKIRQAQQPYDDTATLPTTLPPTLIAQLAQALEQWRQPTYTPVINLTGVLLHTNMGRAPLPAGGLDYLVQVSQHYSNLEYDLHSGQRRRRDQHTSEMLALLAGAEAALLVNNNAAALHLITQTLAGGRTTLVSRGELIEIGDGFRLHEIIAASGSHLREVGSTNRTSAADFAAAIDAQSALLLRAHPSNFIISGFHAAPELTELLSLAKKHQLPLVYDLGSALFEEGVDSPNVTQLTAAHATADQWTPLAELCSSGVDLVCFSADKLLGGAQAGIIVGKQSSIDSLRRHPLFRALRLDKMNLALLDWVARQYLHGTAASTLPLLQMLDSDRTALQSMAESLVAATREALSSRGFEIRCEERPATVGGGALPGSQLPSPVVCLTATATLCEALDQRLRQATPPIIVGREKNVLLLHLRTLHPPALLPHLIATLIS